LRAFSGAAEETRKFDMRFLPFPNQGVNTLVRIFLTSPCIADVIVLAAISMMGAVR
jgi:hypothetical protein